MREKELRLALVCYGGVSLAVYIHGITKEIWRFARASRAFHAREPAAAGSQAIYRAMFEEIEQVTSVRLRLLVDIVAGASAGGINGIFLAQAISTGQSLDPLTDLWLTSADVEALIDVEAAPSSRLAKAWALPIAWLAAKRNAGVDELVEPAAREEVRAKLSHFVRSRWFEPPFGGAHFTSLLLDAVEAMATAPTEPRLLPRGQPLDLFVTVTDFRGHPERLRLNSPPEVVETEHRLVVPFSDHGEAVSSLANPAELAFAARATSSFPGAFPPFTVAELDGVLAQRGADWPGRAAFLERILPRQAAAHAIESAVLIDGSVLANAPFRPAIDALSERPAHREVDRRFIYIDPSPGLKIHFGGALSEAPGFFKTIIGAVSELPRQQPIRDNLEDIAERSARVERLRSIVANIRGDVEAEIEALFGHTLFLDKPTPARLAAWRQRAQKAATAKAGFAYAAYGHLKVDGVIDLIVSLLHQVGGEKSVSRRHEIRDAIAATIRARFDDGTPTFAGRAGETTITFLRNYDLGFRIRRLRRLARRLSDIEMDHDEAELVPIRDAVYASLALYLECNRSDPHIRLRREVRRLGRDAEVLLDRLAESMDLMRLDTETDVRMAEALSALSKDIRREMLLTYLGFPYIDVTTLPLLQGEGVDEFDPIKIDRISPDDARAIRTGGAEATLKGIQFNSFGAFFSRAYRENDYLWGRLHGAERMIDIVLSTLGDNVRLKPGRVAGIKRAAFLAILDEEEPRLTAIPQLITSLRQEVGEP